MLVRHSDDELPFRVIRLTDDVGAGIELDLGCPIALLRLRLRHSSLVFTSEPEIEVSPSRTVVQEDEKLAAGRSYLAGVET